MPSPVDALRTEFQSALSSAVSVATVKAVRDQFLSRKHGRVTAMLKAVGLAAPEERKALGRAGQRAEAGDRSRARRARGRTGRHEAPPDAVDVTLPGRVAAAGLGGIR